MHVNIIDPDAPPKKKRKIGPCSDIPAPHSPTAGPSNEFAPVQDSDAEDHDVHDDNDDSALARGATAEPGRQLRPQAASRQSSGRTTSRSSTPPPTAVRRSGQSGTAPDRLFTNNSSTSTPSFLSGHWNTKKAGK